MIPEAITFYADRKYGMRVNFMAALQEAHNEAKWLNRSVQFDTLDKYATGGIVVNVHPDGTTEFIDVARDGRIDSTGRAIHYATRVTG